MPNTAGVGMALVACLSLLVAACSDEPAGSRAGAAAEDEASTTEEASMFPVTIEHARGSTTLEERPERIVTLNVQWTDAVVAMGVDPVGYVLNQANGEADPFPWQDGALEGSERIDAAGTVPVEKIAALRPDVILTTYLVTEEADFERLEAIAPTIGLLGALEVDPWEDQVEVVGELLGEPAKAQEVIDDVHGQIENFADELPGLQGKTYVAANYVEGDGIYVIADPDDGASRLFYGLGMEIAPSVLALDAEAVGRVQISTEQVEVLDAEFIGILTNGSDLGLLPGWEQLPAVQNGSVVDLEFADIVGLNTPTRLSLPHVIDVMRPALEKVAS